MEFFYPPRASRDGSKVKRRIVQDTQKALEKYKLAEEQAKMQPDKVSLVESSEFDRPVFETAALRYADVKYEEDAERDDSDSYYSHHSVYFHNTFLNRCCNKLTSSTRGMTLTCTQVMCFTFLLQVPLVSLVHHVSIVQKFGGMMVLIIYTVIGFAICVPVHMMYMFAGFFTKRSYIRYWSCVPILKGVGFALGGISMYHELSNVLFSSIAMQYIIMMFSNRLPWHNCEFQHASSSCVPMRYVDKATFDQHCCTPEMTDANCSYIMHINHTFKYAAFDYYIRHILRLDEDGDFIAGTTSTMLTTILSLTWFLIYSLLTLGLRRIAKMMMVINLAMMIVLVPVAIMIFVISPGYSMVREFSSNFSASATDYKFWLYTGLNIIHRELPADVIAYGAISDIAVSVTVDTVIIYILKFFYTVLFTVWTSVGVKYQLTHYAIKHSECIITDGDVLFFALFPDIISHLPAPQLWLIVYFLIIFFWGISTAIYVYSAFVEAIVEEFRDTEKWKMIIYVFFCTGSALASIYNLTPSVMDRLKTETLEVIPQMKVFMLCISFVGLYFYSITTFRHDYHFYTGQILGNYWIVGLKISMLLVFIATVLNWFNVLYENVSNLSLLLVFVPVLLGILLTVTRYSLKISKTLISPTAKWGPPSRSQKLARIKFDPSHDLHYRSVSQKCPHSCLLYSNGLKKEVKYWFAKKNEAEGNNTLGHVLDLSYAKN